MLKKTPPMTMSESRIPDIPNVLVDVILSQICCCVVESLRRLPTGSPLKTVRAALRPLVSVCMLSQESATFVGDDIWETVFQLVCKIFSRKVCGGDVKCSYRNAVMLILGRGCELCDAHPNTSKVYWQFGKRICQTCLRENTICDFAVKNDLKGLGPEVVSYICRGLPSITIGMYKRYVDLSYDLTFLWSADVYARAREFLIKDAVCFGDSSSYCCYTELCELATAKVIADKEAARLSCVSLRKASLDELYDHIMSSQDLAHVFKCCASVVPKGQLLDKLLPKDQLVVSCTTSDILGVTHALLNRKLAGFITKLCIDLKDLPHEAIIAHADAISVAVMAEVAAAVGDSPKLTHAVFSRKYGDAIKQACIASQDAEIRKQVHCMVSKIVKRICVRDWDSMFRGVF